MGRSVTKKSAHLKESYDLPLEPFQKNNNGYKEDQIPNRFRDLMKLKETMEKRNREKKKLRKMKKLGVDNDSMQTKNNNDLKQKLKIIPGESFKSYYHRIREITQPIISKEMNENVMQLRQKRKLHLMKRKEKFLDNKKKRREDGLKDDDHLLSYDVNDDDDDQKNKAKNLLQKYRNNNEYSYHQRHNDASRSSSPASSRKELTLVDKIKFGEVNLAPPKLTKVPKLISSVKRNHTFNEKLTDEDELISSLQNSFQPKKKEKKTNLSALKNKDKKKIELDYIREEMIQKYRQNKARKINLNE